jgi:hypothetical protein
VSKEELDILRVFEQMETTLSDLGPVLATYYKSLLKHGLPDGLARDLVVDWHHVFWEITLGKARDNGGE